MSIIDALAAGLSFAGRRPWLALIPAAIDGVLWLMPQISVDPLIMRLLVVWEALLKAVYTPAQLAEVGDIFAVSRDLLTQIGQQADVAMALTSGWLAPTSALASEQANRWLLISDGVLAPVGIGLQLAGAQPLVRAANAIELNSVWGAVLVGVGLWLVAQVLATCFLRWVALSLDGTVVGHSDRDHRVATAPISVMRAPFLRVFVRLLGLSVLLSAVLLFLRTPLALIAALATLSRSSILAILFVLSGGLTLWLTLSFLVSMFLASDAMLLDGQGFGSGIMRSLILTRASGMRTLGFVILVNLLMLGARAVWGLIGQTPVGTATAILGNGFLVTGMALASMIYYDGLRREWQAAVSSKANAR